MSHNWECSDFQGTQGWFHCTNCGSAHHETQHGDELVAPAIDLLVGYPPRTCEEMVEFKADRLVEKIIKLLCKAGEQLPFNQPVEAVRKRVINRLKMELPD